MVGRAWRFGRGRRRVVEGCDGHHPPRRASRSKAPWETILQRPTSSAAAICSRPRAARACNAWSFRLVQPRGRLLPTRATRIGTDVTVRPDTRYGVSKAFGEALGLALRRQTRIARAVPQDRQPRRQGRSTSAGWRSGSSPEDLVQLIRIGLEHPDLELRDLSTAPPFNERSLVGQQSRLRLWLPPDRRRAEDFLRTGSGRAHDQAHHADPVGDLLPGRHVLQPGVQPATGAKFGSEACAMPALRILLTPHAANAAELFRRPRFAH